MQRFTNSVRLWSAVGITATLLAVLALIPYYGLFTSAAVEDGVGAVPKMVVLLLPGTMALAFPVALLLVTTSSSKVGRRQAVGLALWSTIASLLLIGWIVPAANSAIVSTGSASGVKPREASIALLLRSAEVPESRSELFTRLTIVVTCSIAAVGGLLIRKTVQRFV
jgi:hypothetical protein